MANGGCFDALAGLCRRRCGFSSVLTRTALKGYHISTFGLPRVGAAVADGRPGTPHYLEVLGSSQRCYPPWICPGTRYLGRRRRLYVQASAPVSERVLDPGGDQPALPDLTPIPRFPGVTDGPWTVLDAALVKQVQAANESQRTGKGSADDCLLCIEQETMEKLVQDLGQPRYRAKQISDALLHGARTIDDLVTLPKTFREALMEAGLRTGRSLIHAESASKDGTRKFLLRLQDGRVIETVGIPVDEENHRRLTVCVSSQVGCPMRCTFCATGKGGFARNLLAHEIVDQVLTVQEEFGSRVSNVVFMGMGEPLLNLREVLKAHAFLNKQMGIGARHITISTVGVPNAIAKLASQQLQSTLAVSLHAPNQALRESLVPSAKAYPLEALLQDCQRYFDMTGRRVTYEYTLMAAVNDTPQHAKELATLLKKHRARSHVNVIPWNPVADSSYRRPDRKSVSAFTAALEEAGIPVSIRHTRGLEASAACGQLRNIHVKEPLAPLPPMGSAVLGSP